MQELYNHTKREMRVQRVQLPIDDRTVTSEVGGEVSLPDYQPEIKRLLRVSATVQPPAHYVGGGCMEFTGTVDLCIYYTGNDGQLYCYPTSQDYAFRVPLEAGADFDLSDGLICYATCESDAVVSRVSGPRRMSVKCRLRARVKAYASCVIEERRQGEADQGEERLHSEAVTAALSYTIGAPVRLSDDVPLEREGDRTREWRIVSGDAGVTVTEAGCAGGQVHYRGEAVVKLLLACEEGDAVPITVRRSIPLDGSVALEGASAGGEAVVVAHCTQLDLSMEDGRVTCELEIVPEVWAHRRDTLSYTSDLYAIGRESACERRSYRLPCVLRCINGNMTVSEALSYDELGVAKGARVADVCGSARIERVEAEHGRYAVSGKCRYTLLLEHEGEMLSKELERPFRYLVDGPSEPCGEVRFQGQATLTDARARTDAERLSVEAELGVSVWVECEQEIGVVCGFSVGDAVKRPTGQMLLCYPTPTDTLWSVGKRYAVSLDALAENNHLPAAPRADVPASLEGVHCLVV